MEKISRIVAGNSRVASTDLKSAAAVRPGAPSFGRPMGQSTAANTGGPTTAERAVALHNEQIGKKKTGGDQVVQAMADSFFMGRIARPMDEQIGEVSAGPVEVPEDADQPAPQEPAVQVSEQPSGYKPRGSFVDVRA